MINKMMDLIKKDISDKNYYCLSLDIIQQNGEAYDFKVFVTSGLYSESIFFYTVENMIITEFYKGVVR